MILEHTETFLTYIVSFLFFMRYESTGCTYRRLACLVQTEEIQWLTEMDVTRILLLEHLCGGLQKLSNGQESVSLELDELIVSLVSF